MNVAPVLFAEDQTQSPYGRRALAFRRVTFFAGAKKATKETPSREIKPAHGACSSKQFADSPSMARSENGDSTPPRLSEVELTRKVLSFGYFSLHQQRKVTRRKAKPLHARRTVDFDPLQDDRNNNAPTEITMSGKQAATVVDRHLPKEAAPCVAG